MKILITGAAGFIGYNLSQKLAKTSFQIIGLDNLNEYYEVSLKIKRLKELGIGNCKAEFNYNEFYQSNVYDKFKFIKLDLIDRENILRLFENEKFDYVCHLAAQAGVRYSIENPFSYIDSNIVGFINIIEGCRRVHIKNFIYASTSSVYGLNTKMPLSEIQSTEHPMSLYAATKKSNEMIAHSYSHLYKIPTIGLRFFTVYGPWGRPDMALFKFTKAILNQEEIDVYNFGQMVRDFTYIDDIVSGVIAALQNPPVQKSNWNSDSPDPSESSAPYQIYNIGNSNPVNLLDYIKQIEKCLEVTAIYNFLPMQMGDVPNTWANIDKISNELHYKPLTTIEKGVSRFINWYLKYYKICK